MFYATQVTIEQSDDASGVFGLAGAAAGFKVIPEEDQDSYAIIEVTRSGGLFGAVDVTVRPLGRL